MKQTTNKQHEEVEQTNSISIGDFEVESTTASLKELEECIDRLISKHKDFAEFRRKKNLLENSLGVG